jgi:hypothetical protein
MVSLGSLQSEQADAQELLADLGMVGEVLKPHELIRFGRAFERQFVNPVFDREIVDLMMRHRGEILVGAMVAKRQMEAEIDGEQPAAGKIGGPLAIRACWLGVGDDWEDIFGIYTGAQNSWTTGTPQNWIHSGTNLMAGVAGNAIRILENAVHIIIGIGTLHASPKIESSQFTIDGKTRPIHLLFRPQKIGAALDQRRIHELDNGIILKKDTTLLAKIFISSAIGGPSVLQQDYPFLMGASFVKEDQLRVHDPVGVPGVTAGVITTT